MEYNFIGVLREITNEKDSFNKVYKLVEDLLSKIQQDKDIDDLNTEFKKIKVTKDEMKEALIESMIEARISKWLTTATILLMIHQIEPEMLNEELKALKNNKSKDLGEFPYIEELTSLIESVFIITKKNMIEALRKKRLKISPEGQNEVFDKALEILNECKKKNFRCTMKKALNEANAALDYPILRQELEDNIGKYVNRFKQYELNKLK